MCTHIHICTQTHTGARAHAGSTGVMRNQHLPARCTPAVNQCLEGAAGEATPREMRAAKGHLKFPQPLTVAAWNEPGACQPLSCLLPFPDGEPGLREGQVLSEGHTSVAAGAGLPAQPAWPELGLSPPRPAPDVCPTPTPAVFPACKEEDPGCLGYCLRL